jgi:hypothetical protein
LRGIKPKVGPNAEAVFMWTTITGPPTLGVTHFGVRATHIVELIFALSRRLLNIMLLQ